jgi:hypothetical protein
MLTIEGCEFDHGHGLSDLAQQYASEAVRTVASWLQASADDGRHLEPTA